MHGRFTYLPTWALLCTFDTGSGERTVKEEVYVNIPQPFPYNRKLRTE
jgi:hypothetical protein